MSRRRISTAAAWHARLRLVVLLLLLLPVGGAWSQVTDPAWARPVRLAPGTRPLGAVLAELSRQGRLPLSYSSSLVPVARSCRLPAGPARPLGVVLGEVLAAAHLAYGLLNGQLVLWPAHAPLPAGVVAVNGRPTRPGPPARPLAAAPGAPGPATGRTGRTGGAAASTAAAGSRPVGLSTPMPEAGGSIDSEPRNQNVIKQKSRKRDKQAAARPTSASGSSLFAAKRPTPGASEAASAAPPPSVAVSRARPGGSNLRQLFTPERPPNAPPAIPKGRRQPGRPPEPVAAQSRAQPPGPRRGNTVAARQAAATSALSANPTRPRAARGQPTADAGRAGAGSVGGRARSGEQRPRPVVLVPASLLAPLLIRPTPGPASGRLPLALPTASAPGVAPVRSPAAEPDKPAPASAGEPFGLARLLHPSYLHAEAWGSETLPLSAGVKVGIPRIYLVLGVAAGPAGRPSGGPAGGFGFGTAGQPRGRFTPSLDLLQWFLPSGPEVPGAQLTQLRPLLAWQIKRDRRWLLIGGPTFNLAAGTRRDSVRTPGDGELGRGRWLGLDAGDAHSVRRLWPGVQVGLRF